MSNFNTNTLNHDEWLTPPEIIKSLGIFDLDPCSPCNRPWDTAFKHYTKEVYLNQKQMGALWLIILIGAFAITITSSQVFFILVRIKKCINIIWFLK